MVSIGGFMWAENTTVSLRDMACDLLVIKSVVGPQPANRWIPVHNEPKSDEALYQETKPDSTT